MKPHHLPDPIFVADQANLERMIKKLAQEAMLAVDTEANSLHAYQEQVCLIQISTIDADYLIDPLALENIAPLGEIFQNPAIEKIFHASEYDVIMLDKDLELQFANIFDTMVAARILGRKKMGLDTLLDELLGVQVSKGYQKADWGKRPLPNKMLRYAQVDTHYLIDLRNVLASQLKQKDRWEIAQEDFTRTCQAHERPSRHKLSPRWRGNGPQNLSPREAAVYKKLCEYRDKIAKKQDKPLFKVFSRQILVTLAEASPTSQREIQNIKGVPHWVVKRYGVGLLECIQEGLRAEPYFIATPQRPSRTYLARVQALKQWRKEKAREMGVNSAVILPRYLLEATAKENPRTKDALEQILEEIPWRVNLYGEEILEVLK